MKERIVMPEKWEKPLLEKLESIVCNVFKETDIINDPATGNDLLFCSTAVLESGNVDIALSMSFVEYFEVFYLNVYVSLCECPDEVYEEMLDILNIINSQLVIGHLGIADDESYFVYYTYSLSLNLEAEDEIVKISKCLQGIFTVLEDNFSPIADLAAGKANAEDIINYLIGRGADDGSIKQ